MTARANELKASGKDVVSFAAGEPDFATPIPVCEAAIEAIKAGKTKYAPSRGVPELRQAIIAKCQRENGFEARADQIVVGTGAKQCLYNALQVLIGPGDEVVLFGPYWMTYADQILLAGGKPVVVQTTVEDGFVPTAAAFAAAITPRTKAVVLNTPSNPTGAMIPPETLGQIVRVALENDLWIISDEIYERLTYGSAHVSVVTLVPEAAERTVTVLGCSKSYSMTGWRIGFSISTVAVASAMSNLQDQVTSNATTFSQFGAVAALNLPPSVVEEMRVEFQTRRDLMVEAIRPASQVKLVVPQGAFYLFADFSAYLGGRVRTDVELAEHLLDSALVACVPGSVFEGPGCLRFSYATSRENIAKGMARVVDALQTL